jgi:hypothetical protein
MSFAYRLILSFSRRFSPPTPPLIRRRRHAIADASACHYFDTLPPARCR